MGLSTRRINSGKPYTDALAASTTQEFELGTLWAPNNDPGGRKYRYALNGAVALAAGKLCQGPAVITNHQSHVGGAGTVANAGDKEITIGLTMTTPTTLDQYKGGFVTFNLVTGLGQIYPIVGNDASITPILTLGEAIVTAGDTTTEFTLLPNIFNGVLITPATTLTNEPCGVPRIAVAAGSYFWIQTAGPAVIIQDTNTTEATVGEAVGVEAASAVAGAVGVATGIERIVGTSMQEQTAADYGAVNLTMDR
jgi:hypothetical protein